MFNFDSIIDPDVISKISDKKILLYDLDVGTKLIFSWFQMKNIYITGFVLSDEKSNLKNNTNIFSELGEIVNFANFEIIKCVHLIFENKQFLKISANYIIFIILLINITILILFICKDYNKIKTLINEIINVKKIKEKNDIKNKGNSITKIVQNKKNQKRKILQSLSTNLNFHKKSKNKSTQPLNTIKTKENIMENNEKKKYNKNIENIKSKSKKSKKNSNIKSDKKIKTVCKDINELNITENKKAEEKLNALEEKLKAKAEAKIKEKQAANKQDSKDTTNEATKENTQETTKPTLPSLLLNKTGCPDSGPQSRTARQAMPVAKQLICRISV